MDFAGICDRLKAIGAPGVVRFDEPSAGEGDEPARAGQAFVVVEPAHIVEFLFVCRDDQHLSCEQIADVFGTDPKKDDEYLWVGYELLSVSRRHRLAVKCLIPKSDPRIPSATAVYRGARWSEREAAEMFGIVFEGHPDPRNILLPDDWVGHPLRKDYEFPVEYHGISCV
jgi:NADH-quinone oxidoreductase subunit C